MKKLSKVLSLFLVLLCLCACSSGKKVDLTGDWQLLRIESENDPFSEEDMENLRNLGLNIVLSLKEDGTGTFDMYSDVSDVTYDARQMKLSMQGSTLDMRYENDLLILSEEGITTLLVFERVTEE